MSRARHRAAAPARRVPAIARYGTALVLAASLVAAPVQAATLSSPAAHTRAQGARWHPAPLPTLEDGNGIARGLEPCATAAPTDWCRYPSPDAAPVVRIMGTRYRIAHAVQSFSTASDYAAPAASVPTFTTEESR